MALKFSKSLYEYSLYEGQIGKTLTFDRAYDANLNIFGSSYSMPETPEGMNFNANNRTLTGIPNDFGEKYYPLISSAGSDSAGTVIKINIHHSRAGAEGLHDCIFFKYPINFKSKTSDNINNRNAAGSGAGDVINDISDNNYNTFNTDSRYVINTTVGGEVSPGGTGTKITHLFIKCINVDSISVLPDTGTDISLSIPTLTLGGITYEAVRNWEGRPTRIDPDGYQNLLYKLPDFGIGDNNIAKQLIITTQGTNSEIYEIMVLEEALILPANAQFRELAYKLSDRSSILKEDLAKRITKVPGVEQDRWKWDIDYVALFHPRNVNNLDVNLDTYNKLINFIKNRVNDNFAIAGEYTRYPERVSLSTFPDPEVQINFLSTYKSGGETVAVSVMEL